jgi:AcrR family transcriptional regulator
MTTTPDSHPPKGPSPIPGTPDAGTLRTRIIERTVDMVGRTGPASFSAKDLCADLGIAPSLINYHFGSRDRLLAEATVVAYAAYTDRVWESVEAADRDPESRLRAWITSAVSWQVSYRGLGVILNYPTSSLEISRVIEEEFRSTLTQHAELHLARLIMLVRDLRRGAVSALPLALNAIPREQLLDDFTAIELASSTGWSVLGLAVWMAGQHMPSEGISETEVMRAGVVASHINRLIDQIRP